MKRLTAMLSQKSDLSREHYDILVRITGPGRKVELAYIQQNEEEKT
jgi:hypothetical protein